MSIQTNNNKKIETSKLNTKRDKRNKFQFIFNEYRDEKIRWGNLLSLKPALMLVIIFLLFT